MALTDTTASKKFIAGAPDIILKGDYRRDKPDMKMASDDMNERFLEQLYEQLLDEGFSPEEAAKKARQLAAERSMADGGRAQYGLGSIVKSVKKAVKGVGKGIKSLAKSDLGKAALLIGGGMYAGGLGPFAKGARFGDLAGAGFLSNLSIPNVLKLTGDKTGTGAAIDALKIGGAGAAITGLLAQKEELNTGDPDDTKRRAQVIDQLKVQFSRLYPKGEGETPEDYDTRITAMVEAADDQTVDVGNMAEGGRVQYSNGSVLTLMDGTKVQIPKGAYKDGKFKDIIYSSSKGDLLREEIVKGLSFAAGGRVGRAFGSDKLVEQASGIEGLPINVNSKGVKELDMRETGGFIPPVGVKEKADDIPAMLSNNEFVFTADAVRAAGGGSVNKGAQRMYDLMKNLESKVV